MASPLAQIDENSSFVQPNGNDGLRLPHLLACSAAHTDAVGEMTPEHWPMKSQYAHGDSTPEAWPKTPTPKAMHQWFGEQTPESWPEFAPSFRFDAQQATPHQAPAMVNPLPSMMPMWTPPQVTYPFGMVFGQDLMNAPSMSVPGSNMIPPVLKNSPFGQPANTANGIVDEPSARMAPANASIARAPIKLASTTCSEKQRSPGADSGGPGQDTKPVSTDDIPVAVYVDLSALRERGRAAVRGGNASR